MCSVGFPESSGVSEQIDAQPAISGHLNASGEKAVKILHVTDTFLPVLGGIEILVDDLSRNQRRHGHDVTVLTAARGSGPDPEPGVIRLPQRFTGLWPTLEALSPDVVHCHSSIFSPLAWRAARQAAEVGIPTVVTMHSMVPAASVGSLAVSIGTRAIPREVCWTAVSEAAAAALQPLVPDGVQVLPNGIDVASCRPATPGTAAVPTLVSVMRMARRKRPLALIRMLVDIREQLGDRPWQAVLVGDGQQAGAVESRLRAVGLDDRVWLTGRLERPEVLKVLAGADLYLAPSRLEAFGLAALEARCSGLPVVAMRSGGVGEFVRDGVHGYLVEDDREMARRAGELLADRGLRRRMAQACRRDDPDLDWSSTVERSISAYHRGRRSVPGMVAAA